MLKECQNMKYRKKKKERGRITHKNRNDQKKNNKKWRKEWIKNKNETF